MSDLLDFLDRYNCIYSQTNKHSRAGWVQINECPECGSQNYHLGIKLDLSRASCYKCGYKRVGQVLQAITQAPWNEIKELLGARYYIHEKAVTTTGKWLPPVGLKPLKECPYHLKYLQSRQIDPEYAESVWGIQGTSIWSDYAGRLFIPILYRKRPVSWTTRAVLGQEPRYMNAPPERRLVDEKQLLYGSDLVTKGIIIVEGPFDAINVGPGAVATLGISYTQAQLAKMVTYSRRIICFDNSADAQRRARNLGNQLAAFPGTTLVVNLDAKDPGSASRQEVESLRKLL